jgi:hypothetical protein
MRRISLGLLALTLLASPLAARAGFLFEASIGSGVRTGVGSNERIPTNLMATVGFGITDMLKLEVGGVANFGDVNGPDAAKPSSYDVDVRGMVVIAPPAFPLYFRGIYGATSLKVGPVKPTYGGAVGIGFGLFGIGAFGELGALQRSYEVAVPGGGSSSEKGWQIEGRFGLSFG